jgi:hypothetical protein
MRIMLFVRTLELIVYVQERFGGSLIVIKGGGSCEVQGLRGIGVVGYMSVPERVTDSFLAYFGFSSSSVGTGLQYSILSL